MTMITIDFTEEQNRKIDMFRAKNGLSSKSDAVRIIIDNLKV